MSGVACDDIACEQFLISKALNFISTNNALVLTSVSVALQNVGLTAKCLRMEYQ